MRASKRWRGYHLPHRRSLPRHGPYRQTHLPDLYLQGWVTDGRSVLEDAGVRCSTHKLIRYARPSWLAPTAMGYMPKEKPRGFDSLGAFLLISLSPVLLQRHIRPPDQTPYPSGRGAELSFLRDKRCCPDCRSGRTSQAA